MTTEASRDLALGVRHRAFELERGLVDAQGRAEFACSSEEPVLSHDWSIGRYLEILDHSPGAIRMDRLRSGAPLLKDHNREVQIGVIEDAAIANRCLRVRARFGNSEAAKAERADVADGIRSKCSVGYLIHELRLEEKRADGIDVYRAVSWEPLEVSTVAIPADPTVGFGRAAAAEFEGHLTKVRGDFSMTTGTMPNTSAPNGAPHPAVRDLAAEERDRCAEIMAIAKRFNVVDDGLAAIQAGTPWQQFRDKVWAAQPEPVLLDRSRGHLGMRGRGGFAPDLSPRDQERWQSDFFRFLRNRADGRHERTSVDELSDQLLRERGQSLRTPGGVLVPLDYLVPVETRDLTAGTAASGGHLVATNLLAGTFGEFQRGRSVIGRMGATMLPGMVGNGDIPLATAGATAAFVNEGSAISEATPTFAKRSLVPRTLGVFEDISRKMLLQATPAAEGVVRNDILGAITAQIDQAAIAGSGVAPIPRGILNTSGISSITWVGTTAPTKYASVIACTTAVANANIDDRSSGWVATPAGRAALMQVFPDPGAGQPIWAATREADGRSTLLGWPAMTSTLLPTNLGAGTNEHLLVYGEWSELFVATWGVLELFADPYTLGDTGAVRLRGFLDMDCAVRRPAAFAVTSFIP